MSQHRYDCPKSLSYDPHIFSKSQLNTKNYKLAQYGTDGRLLLTANFKVT